MNPAATLALLLATGIVVSGAEVDFARDVLPILSDKCFHCHGPDQAERKGKLRLDTEEGALRKQDPVIMPGRDRRANSSGESWRRMRMN